MTQVSCQTVHFCLGMGSLYTLNLWLPFLPGTIIPPGAGDSMRASWRTGLRMDRYPNAAPGPPGSDARMG